MLRRYGVLNTGWMPCVVSDSFRISVPQVRCIEWEEWDCRGTVKQGCLRLISLQRHTGTETVHDMGFVRGFVVMHDATNMGVFDLHVNLLLGWSGERQVHALDDIAFLFVDECFGYWDAFNPLIQVGYPYSVHVNLLGD